MHDEIERTAVSWSSVDVVFESSRNATVRSREAGPGAPIPQPVAASPEVEANEADRFDDEGEIARGGMGSIRRVLDRRLLRRQAMKVLDANVERGSPAMERFVEEARIAGQLDHPNIVPIYDLGLRADGAPAFITMKMVVGDTFGAFVDGLGEDRLKSPHLEHALDVILKVCDALSFAHSRGVIHCDIKPGNVMMGSHGQVYVMDWGLAMVIEAPGSGPLPAWAPRRPEHGTVMGTPAYMAPEQAFGRVEDFDERTDVFGLGGTLYRVLTGRPPHAEATVVETVKRARRGQITPPEEVVPHLKLPPELCRITMKALSAEQDARHQSMAELRAEIEAFLRGGGWLPTKTYAQGAVILSEGEIADAAYIIVEGLCEAYKTLGGKTVSLRLMGPGEVFGEAAMFSSQPRTASVVARSQVTLKVVTAESLELELSRNGWMWALVKALAERFRDLDAQLGRLGEKR